MLQSILLRIEGDLAGFVPLSQQHVQLQFWQFQCTAGSYALATAARLLSEKNDGRQDLGMVKRLSACEIMGSATTICSDKTGTLTLNMLISKLEMSNELLAQMVSLSTSHTSGQDRKQVFRAELKAAMTVVNAFICGKRIEALDNMSSISPAVTSLLIEGIAHNTTGSVFMPEYTAELRTVFLVWWSAGFFPPLRVNGVLPFVDRCLHLVLELGGGSRLLWMSNEIPFIGVLMS
ncbi:hypothetical protein LguiB_021380 [Lonicera macranthoides]